MTNFEKLKRTILRTEQRKAKMAGYSIPASMVYSEPVKLVYSQTFNRIVFA